MTGNDAVAAFTAAGGMFRKLLQIAGVQLAILLLIAAAACVTRYFPGRLPALDALLHGGAASLLGGAVLISMTGTLVCLLLTWGRRRSVNSRGPAQGGGVLLVSRVAGWPQALLILGGMAAAIAVLVGFPPLPSNPTAAFPGGAGLATLTLLAFPLLVCERVVVAVPTDHLPEAARLAALLRVPAATALLLAGLMGMAGFGFGFATVTWPIETLGLALLAVAGELAVRTLAVWFSPLPAPHAAQAAIGSLLAACLRPGALRPAAIARRISTQLGIDVTRSWAVTYVRAAAPPVLLGLLALSWGLSGVIRIGLTERGSYERFGVPVAVLHPGLHLLLPWPLGQVRRIEYGVVHSVPVGASPDTDPMPVDTSTADGTPPASANRLWDEQPGTGTSYLIASRSSGQQSFETVSVNIRVLYRIGLDDRSAQRALYGLAAPDALVRSLSDRLLAHFFADRTLSEVLGARREQVANSLRDALQQELNARRSGIEVVAVVVEAMHPPGGAAAAYRSVQAAQIVASTRRAEEVGRAQGTLSVAARDAHDARDQAEAAAAELLGAATAESWQADADVLAYRDGGRAFLLERYFSNLRGALSRAALEIVDHRLTRPDLPVIDLRPPAAVGDSSQ